MWRAVINWAALSVIREASEAALPFFNFRCERKCHGFGCTLCLLDHTAIAGNSVHRGGLCRLLDPVNFGDCGRVAKGGLRVASGMAAHTCLGYETWNTGDKLLCR